MEGYSNAFLVKLSIFPEIKIIDRRLGTQEEISAPSGKFRYLPPHDTSLDQADAGAYKQIFIYVRSRLQSMVVKTTYTFILHRSRTAHNRLKPGPLRHIGLKHLNKKQMQPKGHQAR